MSGPGAMPGSGPLGPEQDDSEDRRSAEGMACRATHRRCDIGRGGERTVDDQSSSFSMAVETWDEGMVPVDLLKV